MALVVHPIFGAPKFNAIINPIYSISANLIYQQVMTIDKITHDYSGFVFFIMNNNNCANVDFKDASCQLRLRK